MKAKHAIYIRHDGWFVLDDEIERLISMRTHQYSAWAKAHSDTYVISHNIFQMNTHPERVWYVEKADRPVASVAGGIHWRSDGTRDPDHWLHLQDGTDEAAVLVVETMERKPAYCVSGRLLEF